MRSLYKSFQYAVDGCIHALQRERNLKLFVAGCSIIIAMGILFELSAWEWIPVTICIGAFLAVELMNTAVEILVDCMDEFACGEKTDRLVQALGRSKDIAAGAALMMAIASAIVVLIIFVPKVVEVL